MSVFHVANPIALHNTAAAAVGSWPARGVELPTAGLWSSRDPPCQEHKGRFWYLCTKGTVVCSGRLAKTPGCVCMCEDKGLEISPLITLAQRRARQGPMPEGKMSSARAQDGGRAASVVTRPIRALCANAAHGAAAAPGPGCSRAGLLT